VPVKWHMFFACATSRMHNYPNCRCLQMASRLLTSGLNHARPLPVPLTFRWTTKNAGT